MKRQNSLLSSSSQLQISSDNLLRRSRSRRRSNSFGCISGLLHFLSNNNHSRRNKSITFVPNNNPELNHVISQSPIPEFDLQIPSSDSPQIVGRSESGERFRGARGPILRLMGLESSTAAEEKQRQQVMEGLEKCEQDLKALKELVEAFESSSEPSPVSVHFVNRHACNNTMLFRRVSAYSGRIQSQQRQQMQRKKPGEEDIFNNLISKFDKIKIHEIVGNCKSEKTAESQSPLLCSKNAMRDSVEGVCKDIDWGQKREVGRIGLTLQHQICGDLIEELVKDFNFSYTCTSTSLPFQACKRRLCF